VDAGVGRMAVALNVDLQISLLVFVTVLCLSTLVRAGD